MLFASQQVPVAALNGFISRAEAFPHLTFAIVAPNLFSPPVRDELLRAHNCRFARARDNPLVGSSRLYMIFTGREGYEVMHPTATFDETSREGLRDVARRAMAASCVKHVQVVYAEGARCGKSHLIASSNSSVPNGATMLRAAVHEDFSTSAIVARLSRIGGGPGLLHLHFDLSFNRLWGPVNVICANLLRLGVIIDEEAGGLVDLSNYEVFISLEVPYLPLPAKDQIPTMTAALFMADVAVHRKVRASEALAPSAPAALQLVGTMLRLHRQKTLSAGTSWRLLLDLDAVDVAAESLVMYLGKVEQRPRQRQDKGFEMGFLQLMNERCRFLIELSRRHKQRDVTLLSGNPSAIEQLFGLFLAEVEGILDSTMNLRSTTIVHVVRTATADFISADLLALRSTANAAPSVLCVEAFHMEDFPSKASLLRSQVATALGLQRTGRLRPILERLQFVLTPSFASKLLILNERRKARSGAVIVGETGVGKVH